jgi:hypothetical protein
MQRQTLIETPFASLWYYPAERIVHHQIHKYIFGEALRELLTRGTAALREHGATKWVSDDRRNGALRNEDKEWADTLWKPATVAAGWKTWAVVPPETIVGLMNIRRIVQESRALGVEVQFFSSGEDALAWIVAR